MIRIRVSGDLSPIVAAVDRLASPDLMPLAEKLRGIMVEGNRAGLLAGTDANGSPTSPLAESTRADPRRGPGPARVPSSEGSRMIADFRGDIDGRGSRIEVTGHWPNTPFVKFHRGPSASNRRPARDPVGIRPDDQLLMTDAVHSFAAELLLRF